jgi:hypothetical protein
MFCNVFEKLVHKLCIYCPASLYLMKRHAFLGAGGGGGGGLCFSPNEPKQWSNRPNTRRALCFTVGTKQSKLAIFLSAEAHFKDVAGGCATHVLPKRR